MKKQGEDPLSIVNPRRGSRGVATFGRDAAFTIPLIRRRRSTLLLDPPMAASGHEHAPKGRPPDGSNAPNAAVRSLRSSYRSRPKAGARLPYSITSSARARRDCGTVRPSAWAVFRLMTSSKVVACWTGISAGLAPLRTFPA